MTETAEADQRDIPFVIELEYSGNCLFQMQGIVPLALFTELPKIGQIAPDLRGGDANELRQLVGGDIANARVLQRSQGAHVDGKAPDDDIGNVGFEVA